MTGCELIYSSTLWLFSHYNGHEYFFLKFFPKQYYWRISSYNLPIFYHEVNLHIMSTKIEIFTPSYMFRTVTFVSNIIHGWDEFWNQEHAFVSKKKILMEFCCWMLSEKMHPMQNFLFILRLNRKYPQLFQFIWDLLLIYTGVYELRILDAQVMGSVLNICRNNEQLTDTSRNAEFIYYRLIIV